MTVKERERYNLVMSRLQELLKEQNEPDTVGERIYRDLLNDILTGVYPAGTRLSEPALCEKYAVSRTPLRSTFKRLETLGLLEYIPNRGEFVRGLTADEVSDMMLMRRDLETIAAGMAARRATEEQISDLDDIFKYMVLYTKTNDVPKMVSINKVFHCLIYEAAGDILLEKILRTLQDFSGYCCAPNYFEPNYLDRVLREHRRIYYAITSKNEKAGAHTMRLHMNNTIKRSGIPQDPLF